MEDYFRNANQDYDHTQDWFYEGKISQCVVDYLRRRKYIINESDHNSSNPKAHGVDIKAYKDKELNLIEVKGYPSKYYTQDFRGKKKGEKKDTSPEMQVKHWFSECLLSSIFNYSKYQKEEISIKIGMAFPFFPKYVELINKAKPFFVDNEIDIDIYLVKDDGQVSVDNLKNKAN